MMVPDPLWQSLRVDDMQAHTKTGSIKGPCNVLESMFVSTAAGPITIRANLLDGRMPDEYYQLFDYDQLRIPKSTYPTRLSMLTSIGYVFPSQNAIDPSRCNMSMFFPQTNRFCMILSSVTTRPGKRTLRGPSSRCKRRRAMPP